MIVLACSDAPEGRESWTMQLLADNLVELGIVDSISDETVRRTLKKCIKPWLKQQWCIPQVNAEYLYRMEDILDLYAQPYNPDYPIVCFDEMPIRLLEDIYPCLPADATIPHIP